MGAKQDSFDDEIKQDENKKKPKPSYEPKMNEDKFVEFPFLNPTKWQEIFNSLKMLSLQLRNADSDFQLVEKAIMKYNKNYENVWNFGNLNQYFLNLDPDGEAPVIRYTILKMIDLVFETPALFVEPIPYLKRGESNSINLSHKQCAVILANAFFCTFYDRIEAKKNNFSNFNFNRY